MHILLYTLIWILGTASVIYPPTEFVSFGLTIEQIFSHVLGSENIHFVYYHIYRTAINLIIVSFVPPLFTFLLTVHHQEEIAGFEAIVNGLTTIFVIDAIIITYLTIGNGFERHGVVKKLKMIAATDKRWQDLATEIEIEYRRIDKVIIQTNAYKRIVATENWIITTSPFTVSFCPQNEAILKAYSSDSHQLTHLATPIGEVQFVNIQVSSIRANLPSFNIRLNVLDFKDFQDRVAARINILPNVQFHTTMLEKFVEVFKRAVDGNPKYRWTGEELDACIGCLTSTANVKLIKQCESDAATSSQNADNRCVACQCRPMWCIDCVAKWFASRQQPENVGEWLQMKCTCPLCRERFCVADVALIESAE